MAEYAEPSVITCMMVLICMRSRRVLSQSEMDMALKFARAEQAGSVWDAAWDAQQKVHDAHCAFRL